MNSESKLQKVRGNRDLSVFDLVEINNFSDADIKLVLQLAEIFKQIKSEKLTLLKGVSIVNAFYEPSTRTRLSFELAGKHLGADTVNITASASSVSKGESYIDTLQTISALQPRLVVIRTADSGAPYLVSKYIPCGVINAGDGQHEHPTQSLLDLKTMLDHHGTLKGKTVTFIGDISRYRVFSSQIKILQRFGVHMRVACPETFLPIGLEQFNIKYYSKIEDALENCDVVSVGRVQKEYGAVGDIPSLREYSKTFGMTPKRFAIANKNAILMHPGPVIRDIDVASALMTHERCKILTQVENGLAVRKALLWLLGDRKDKKIKKYQLI
jgi:aspartate carbamoyltransferase catalytic subunit